MPVTATLLPQPVGPPMVRMEWGDVMSTKWTLSLETATAMRDALNAALAPTPAPHVPARPDSGAT